MMSKDEVLYEIKIEIYAKPEPLELAPEDLEKDYRSEIEQLIESMEGMDTEELSDQVYECYRFDLCAECRDGLHAKLKLKLKEMH
jgi:hypothetical protein